LLIKNFVYWSFYHIGSKFQHGDYLNIIEYVSDNTYDNGGNKDMDMYGDAGDHEEDALNCNKSTLYALGDIKIYLSISFDIYCGFAG